MQYKARARWMVISGLGAADGRWRTGWGDIQVNDFSLSPSVPRKEAGGLVRRFITPIYFALMTKGRDTRRNGETETKFYKDTLRKGLG